jgi:hypothetical protein
MSDINARDAIAHRIRSLLAKTVENGATEAEALAAAAKARAIMDAHRLSQSDIEVQEEPIDLELVDRPVDHKSAAVDACLYGIEAYCGVETWFRTSFDNGTKVRKRRLVIFGLRSDVQMAKYLYQMIAASIRLETAAFARANQNSWRDAPTTRKINQSFQVGMARRVGQRLSELAQTANATAKTSDGTALVVVKNAVVQQAFADLGLTMGRGLAGLKAFDHGAYHAGQAAGDRVNLSRPIDGAAQGRIGNKE